MEGKVAVIGNGDFVMPFSALGLDTFSVSDDPQEITEKAQTVLDAKYTLVVVAENIAKTADKVFSATEKAAVPCVVVVPFTTEPEGFAIRALGETLKMATGINILQNS